MIYLALDQALKITGFAVFEDKNLIDKGICEVAASIPIEQRLLKYYNNLNKLYEKYQFDYLFFEDVQKQQNLETYKKLCYVQAITILWCCQNKIKFNILAPSHWRSILKDKYNIAWGKARKDQKKAAQEWVKNNYDLDITEDEADAICIGAAGITENTLKQSAW